LICYNIDKATGVMVNKFHPELNPSDLSTVEKYHFYAKLNSQNESAYITSAETIFPIPYPKK
jgi:hypothetical protein